MIFLLCCIGFVALVNGQVVKSFSREKSRSRRIIDGNVAQPSQFPYVARLFYGNIPGCSATIIHERWALTAGHCIEHNRRDPKLLVGSVNSNTDNNGVYYNAERLIQHEQYTLIPGKQNNGKEYVVNDIGLVRLNRPIAFSANVQTIRVPNYVENYANAIGNIVGFGLRNTGVPNDQLLYGTVRLITNEECRAFYPYVLDKHLCAAIVGRNSPCSGDSGGPLIAKGYEIGIMSTIADENICNPYAGPSLFTKVDRFKPWIQQHLAAYGDRLP